MAIFVFFFIKIEVEKTDKKMTFSQEFGWVKIIIFFCVCISHIFSNLMKTSKHNLQIWIFSYFFTSIYLLFLSSVYKILVKLFCNAFNVNIHVFRFWKLLWLPFTRWCFSLAYMQELVSPRKFQSRPILPWTKCQQHQIRKRNKSLGKKEWFFACHLFTLVKGNILPKKKLCRKIWPGCQLKLTWKYNSHMTNLMTFEQFCSDNFFAQHKHLGLFSPWRSWGPACPSWDTAWPPSTSAVS